MNRIRRAIDTVRELGRYSYARALSVLPAPEKPERAGRHLVILAPEFPPTLCGGVYRPAALARYASQAGYRVTVLANPGPTHPSAAGAQLMDYVGTSVTVHRVPPSPVNAFHKLFYLVDGGMTSALDFFFVARNLLAKSPPDVIVATAPPFLSFVAGALLAKVLRCKLLVDYRDEWTSCPFDFVAPGTWDLEWERRALRSADSVVFTTQSQLALARERHGNLLLGKGSVVANAWEPVLAAKREPRHERSDGRILLLYAGMLGTVDIRPFLEQLARLIETDPMLRDRLLVRFIGRKTREAEAVLAGFPFRENLESRPAIPLSEAAQMMASADALLLFHDERYERYLPGKLYEYLASGTPIIMFNETGESRRLLERFRAGWALDSYEPEALHRVLRELPSARKQVEDPAREAWLQENTRERMARRFLDIIERM